MKLLHGSTGASDLATVSSSDDRQARPNGLKLGSIQKQPKLGPSPHQEQDRTSFLALLQLAVGLLRRHTLMISVLTVLAFSLTLIGVSQLKNQYTATAMLVLDRESSRVLETRALPPLNPDGEVELLKSESVALRALRKLGPDLPPDFFPKPGRLTKLISGVTGFVSALFSPISNLLGGDEDDRPSNAAVNLGGADGLVPEPIPEPTVRALRVLKQIVQIRRKGTTDVIAVEVTSTSPSVSARVANAYASAYLDEQRAAKTKSIEQIEQVLVRRLNELDEEVKRTGPQVGLRQSIQDTQIRLKAVSQQRDTISPDARIASLARPPRSADFPGAKLAGTISVIAGTIASFAFALGIAYLKEGASHRIRSEEELEAITGTEVLASVPVVRPARPKGKINSAHLDAIATDEYLNAIRKLYFNLMLTARRGSRPRSVMITSTGENEGKTTLALSFGRMAATAGLSVVVVDCDLHAPKLHRTLGIGNDFGFVDIVTGATDQKPVLQEDPYSACKIISAGRAELLNDGWLIRGDLLTNVLHKLEVEFDLVIVIAPPVGLRAETLMLLEGASTVLYLVRADENDASDIRSSIRQIRRVSQADIYNVLTFTPARG